MGILFCVKLDNSYILVLCNVSFNKSHWCHLLYNLKGVFCIVKEKRPWSPWLAAFKCHKGEPNYLLIHHPHVYWYLGRSGLILKQGRSVFHRNKTPSLCGLWSIRAISIKEALEAATTVCIHFTPNVLVLVLPPSCVEARNGRIAVVSLNPLATVLRVEIRGKCLLHSSPFMAAFAQKVAMGLNRVGC